MGGKGIDITQKNGICFEKCQRHEKSRGEYCSNFFGPYSVDGGPGLVLPFHGDFLGHQKNRESAEGNRGGRVLC